MRQSPWKSKDQTPIRSSGDLSSLPVCWQRREPPEALPEGSMPLSCPGGCKGWLCSCSPPLHRTAAHSQVKMYSHTTLNDCLELHHSIPFQKCYGKPSYHKLGNKDRSQKYTPYHSIQIHELFVNESCPLQSKYWQFIA